MSIQKDDLLTVGVDLPESYTRWSKTGTTKLATWEKEVEMTFNVDFSGVALETVFELAVGALVIDRRPALKKEGFEFCNKNRVVEIKAGDIKRREPAQPRNLAGVLVKALEAGTVKLELKKLSKEQLTLQMKAMQELLDEESASA